MTLTCPECSRTGFSRLTRHLSQAHGLGRDAVLSKYPDITLEVIPVGGVRCSSCGVPVEGCSPRAVYVKCDACRQPDPNANREVVTCAECGHGARTLHPHLRAVHGMTTDDYRAKHPGALLDVPGRRARSESCKEKMSVASTRRWAVPGAREEQSRKGLVCASAWRGKPRSEEHRRRIGDAVRGTTLNLTDEQRKARGERGGAVLRAIWSDPSRRKNLTPKLSTAQKQRYAANPLTHGWGNPDTRAKSLASRIRNGTLAPQGGGRGICGWRVGIPHYCRSTTEANFARVLMLEGIPYEYEPHLFRLSSGSHYLPDFRLARPLEGIVPAGWVELKGWRHADGSLPNGVSEKVAEFTAMTGEPVCVLTMHDEGWRNLEARYAAVIPLWETPTRNLRTHPDVFGRVMSVSADAERP